MHPQGRNDDPAPVPTGETETMVQPGLPFTALLKDRYRIESSLGSGGFAAVYLARDAALHNRPVVIKVLHERQDSREWIEKKFRQECEALSRIAHPGIVGVKDQGSMPDGRPFLVLEFIDGVTLRSVMMKDPGGMALRRAAVLLRQIAQALSAAHDAGVHHRDLKPENIMIRDLADGQELAVIIDFGIATVLDSEVPPSAATMVAGSRYYIAPEQLEGKPEAASDIYALGEIAFEMVTGSRPFRAGPAVDLYQQQRHGPEQNPCALRSDLPPAAGAVILKALSFNAASRHARAAEFRSGPVPAAKAWPRAKPLCPALRSATRGWCRYSQGALLQCSQPPRARGRIRCRVRGSRYRAAFAGGGRRRAGDAPISIANPDAGRGHASASPDLRACGASGADTAYRVGGAQGHGRNRSRFLHQGGGRPVEALPDRVSKGPCGSRTAAGADVKRHLSRFRTQRAIEGHTAPAGSRLRGIYVSAHAPASWRTEIGRAS